MIIRESSEKTHAKAQSRQGVWRPGAWLQGTWAQLLERKSCEIDVIDDVYVFSVAPSGFYLFLSVFYFQVRGGYYECQ